MVCAIRDERMVAYLRSQTALDHAIHLYFTTERAARAGFALLRETAKNVVMSRRKELLDHCGEHGC